VEATKWGVGSFFTIVLRLSLPAKHRLHGLLELLLPFGSPCRGAAASSSD
jgi:hypothetical protein